MTAVVGAVRDAIAEQPLGTGGWVALAWCLGLLVGARALALATYRRTVG